MAILGIDEVGRGPWAGPLVIGAVILKAPTSDRDRLLEAEDQLTALVPPELDPIWADLTDSKKLTKKRRAELAPEIEQHAFATGLGWVSAEELDEVGLSEALRLAARRAAEECLKNARVEDPGQFVGANQNVAFPDDFPVTEIIIDGTQNFLRGTPLAGRVSLLKKADLLVKEVSAASIIAKVARDDYMTTIAKDYQDYGFENHVGYGTEEHRKALETFGPCPEHRTTFKPVAKILGLEAEKKQPPKNTTKVGQTAEAVVAEYLRKQGHKILAKNFKTRLYEIDLISATSDHIYYTEVKYRKNDNMADPLENITARKKRQMAFAADAFEAYLAKRLNRSKATLPSPVLAAASVSGDDFAFQTWLPLI